MHFSAFFPSYTKNLIWLAEFILVSVFLRSITVKVSFRNFFIN